MLDYIECALSADFNGNIKKKIDVNIQKISTVDRHRCLKGLSVAHISDLHIHH